MDKKIDPARLKELKEKLKEVGQEKLAGQLDYLFGLAAVRPPSKSLARADLLSLMDKFRRDAFKLNRLDNKNDLTYIEIFVRPGDFRGNIDRESAEKALAGITQQIKSSVIFYQPETDLTPQYEKNRLSAGRNEPDNEKNLFGYWFFEYDTAGLYAVSSTRESMQGSPKIFDPKMEACLIAEILITAGFFYKLLSFNPHQSLHMVYRYSSARGLTVGSLGSDYFMPSRRFDEDNLSIYIARPLYNILGRTAETAADVTLELLKRLNYQGIVNRNYFLHAVVKYISRELKLSSK